MVYKSNLINDKHTLDAEFLLLTIEIFKSYLKILWCKDNMFAY